MSETIRIAMWSGPRNISTTMMRSFENRPDTEVVDEPFFGCYLAASGADHPYRNETLAVQPTDWREVVASFTAPLAPGKRILFEKHIAYHYPDNEPLDWLLDHRTFLLIRDPRRMLASFSKKYDAIGPVIDSYRVERRIYDFLTTQGIDCPIVDAADILENPRAMMTALCARLGVPFTERMLSWPAGPRATDGPWASHWYEAVNASTGFKPPSVPADEPAEDVVLAARACQPDYEFLRQRRQTASEIW